MGNSLYPNALDTDLELPRVDNNVTEIGEEAINATRSAIINVEGALGILPQGNKVSLAERIAISIDSDGRIKGSALESIGLVSLPITNSQVSSIAGIEETKLNLDHPTQSLRNSINSATGDISTLQAAVDGIGSTLNSHIFGQGSFHDGYQIKINTGTFIGVSGLSATTIGDAINEFSTIFITGDGITPPHINTSLPSNTKHTASFISVDSTNFTTIDNSVGNAQEAFDSIDLEVLGQQGVHVDNFHANGIFKNINSGESFNPNQKKLGPSIGSYVEGTSVVKISGITSFSSLNVRVSDIINISGDGITDAGAYRICALGPKTASESLGDLPILAADELSVFHVFLETQASTNIDVYQAASISSEMAPLACGVRHNETLVDTLSLLNPDAARVVSLGFNGAILNTDGYNINVEVALGNGNVRGLTIPDLHFDRLSGSQSDLVDAKSVAERINAYVSNPITGFHFPITAFRIGNEIAIAHNLVGPQYTLTVLDGYTGNFALGFDAYGADILDLDVIGNTNNLYNVNGISRSSLGTIVDGYATITSTTDTFSIFSSNGASINPLSLGIRAGAVLHITGHPTLDTNGSYTLESVSSATVSVFSSEPVSVVGGSTTFNIKLTDSNLSLNQLLEVTESDLGLVEVFVDENGKALIHQRLTYTDSLGSAVDVINVSNGFPIGLITLKQVASGGSDLRTFTLVDGSVSGAAITIDKDFKGTFKLFHTNNIDSLTIRINSTVSGSGTASVNVSDTLNTDETMSLCVLHFDGVDTITNVVDTRPFGNLSVNQIRDDFIELFSQKQVSDLRSDGVVRGFDVLDMPFVDSFTNMQALPIDGGAAYVNGARVIVETQKVVIQSYDPSGSVIGNVQKIIGINEFGTLRAFDDQLGELLVDGYNSSIEFGKILPLYAIDLDSSGAINEVTDLRLFINNIDQKLDLIVDETNNVLGNFRSIEGALLYAQRYPGTEKLTIRIINEVRPSKALVVPDGVSIIGGSPYGGGQHRIVNTLDLNDHFITLSGNNRLENVEIDSEIVAMDGYLVNVNGSNINIEKCSLKFSETVGSFTNGEDFGIGFGANAINNVKIINNRIDNVFAGIVSDRGCDNLTIRDNHITDLVGVGTETYGIKVSTETNASSNIIIKHNTIEVPSVVSSDIMGIFVDIAQPIDVLRIEYNNIVHKNNDTMTNGIRVESVTTGQQVSNLFISHNYVQGVELDANSIFGIYIGDTKRALVDFNILNSIGKSNNNNIDDAFIKIAANVDYAQISNNILEDGYALSGIDATSTGMVSITDNTVRDVGSKNGGVVGNSTVYIRGNVPRSKVSGNTVTGPGAFGIHWGLAGSRTKVSDNVLNSILGADDAFANYAIRTLGTDMDIEDNTITNMGNNSRGIGTGPGSLRVKISGNTVDGTLMNTLISLTGSENSVSANVLKNTVNNGTMFFELLSTANSLILGNTMRGAANFAFDDGSTTVTGNTFANNKVLATISTRSFNLDATGTTDNFVVGNYVPDTDTSIIGTTSSNPNLIGLNRGLLDTIGVSIVSGIGVTTAADDWVFSDTSKEWAPGVASGTFALYFPLESMPNGSRLVSVEVGGTRSALSVVLEVFKKGIATPFANTLLGTSTVSSGTTFLTTVSASSEVIDYSTNTYFLRIFISGAGITTESVSGVRINIRY